MKYRSREAILVDTLTAIEAGISFSSLITAGGFSTDTCKAHLKDLEERGFIRIQKAPFSKKRIMTLTAEGMKAKEATAKLISMLEPVQN